jgi:hypothetical protein
MDVAVAVGAMVGADVSVGAIFGTDVAVGAGVADAHADKTVTIKMASKICLFMILLLDYFTMKCDFSPRFHQYIFITKVSGSQ